MHPKFSRVQKEAIRILLIIEKKMIAREVLAVVYMYDVARPRVLRLDFC